MADEKTRVYTLWSESGESSIQSLIRMPSGGVIVGWKKVQKAAYYKVFRRMAGTSKWVCIKKTKKNKSISYTDNEAIQGVSYEYMVRAFDKFGTKGKNSISYISA